MPTSLWSYAERLFEFAGRVGFAASIGAALLGFQIFGLGDGGPIRDLDRRSAARRDAAVLFDILRRPRHRASRQGSRLRHGAALRCRLTPRRTGRRQCDDGEERDAKKNRSHDARHCSEKRNSDVDTLKMPFTTFQQTRVKMLISNSSLTCKTR